GRLRGHAAGVAAPHGARARRHARRVPRLLRAHQGPRVHHPGARRAGPHQQPRRLRRAHGPSRPVRQLRRRLEPPAVPVAPRRRPAPQRDTRMSGRVVVVGGGVIGLSVAYHLAEAGVGTVLLERGTLGSGASRATADVLRAYFAGDPVSSALAVRSLAAYREFAARPGADLPLRQVGYLVLFTDPEQVKAFEADLPAQRAAGVEIELIDARAARRLNPLIGGDLPLLAAAWSPQAYVSDTAAIVAGYAAGARRAGARIRTGCPALAISGGRVETPGGAITADAVVCAAGAWSAPLARSAGVDLPLPEPVTQELLVTDPLEALPELPVTLDAASRLLVRLRGDRLLIGM